MGIVYRDSSHGVDWRLELERDQLLPGRLVAGSVSARAQGTIEARALLVTLRAIEHWQYQVTTRDANGHVSTHTETARSEVVTQPVQVAIDLRLGSGDERTWSFEMPVPPLGPATLEAKVAGLGWVLQARFDVPGGFDPAIEVPVRVLQPVALLRSGAVPVGEFALYGASDVGADGVTGSVVLDPVPLCSGMPFTASLTLVSPGARKLQEIRAEIRVTVKATVPSGLEETIIAWQDMILADVLQGERTVELHGLLDERALPTIELPHGRTAATFHVILATAWAADPHLVRDVAIATTLEL
ncbi:MAG: hypothetical protein ABIQ17_02620 [Candidatus Limnocylindrales bacterium]